MAIVHADVVETPRTRRPTGASRDLTGTFPSRSTNAVPLRESPRRRRQEKPQHVPAYRQRLGSRQVVSIRGRRVTTAREAGLFPKVSAIVLVLVVAGIAAAMWLSGLATQQTFRINELVAQDSQLSNELETLNRDLQAVSSSAELARRAEEAGLVIPNQPGILIRQEDGEITESRPATGETSRIIDTNGAPVRAGVASSDPAATSEIEANLEAVPQGQQVLSPGQVPGLAPYSNGASRGGAANEQQAEPAPEESTSHGN